MKIKITLTEEMLGTASGNKDVHKEFIASKSADAAKVEEELGALHAEELENKAKTVFPRDEDGRPILFDYQVKGFIKECFGIILDLDGQKDIAVGKTKVSKWSFKRVVDNFVFVSPRKIRLSNEVGSDCTRPLRADTMKGERVSLATSETVPAGTTFECEISTLSTALDPLIGKCLDYGKFKGLGQWRNSGKGRFTWEIIK